MTTNDALIDLGTASVETQGSPPKQQDLVGIGAPHEMSDDD